MDKLILIPAYKPDERLVAVCRELSGEYEVLTVDDGGGSDYDLFHRRFRLSHCQSVRNRLSRLHVRRRISGGRRRLRKGYS